MNVYCISTDINEYRMLVDAPGQADIWSDFYGLCYPHRGPLPKGVVVPTMIFQDESAPVGDFIGGLYGFVLNQRAYAILRDMLAPCGEFIRVPSPDGEFMHFRIPYLLDALDYEKSELEWEEDELLAFEGGYRQASFISRYVFREDVIGDRAMFVLANDPLSFFATDKFVSAVQEHKLTGLIGLRVYPDRSKVQPLEKPFGAARKRRGRGR